MKKYLLSLTLLIGYTAAFAQSNWSVGFRTGVEKEKNYDYREPNTKVLFSPQLFLTKRVFKNLEAEANLGYKSPSKSTIYNNNSDYGNYESTTYYSSQIIELGLMARYFIYKNNDWAIYANAGLTGTKTFVKHKSYTSAHISGGGYVPEQSINDNYHTISFVDQFVGGVGVNKKIATNWILNTQFTVGYIPSSALSISEISPFKPKLQIGFAYSW